MVAFQENGPVAVKSNNIVNVEQGKRRSNEQVILKFFMHSFVSQYLLENPCLFLKKLAFSS